MRLAALILLLATPSLAAERVLGDAGDRARDADDRADEVKRARRDARHDREEARSDRETAALLGPCFPSGHGKGERMPDSTRMRGDPGPGALPAPQKPCFAKFEGRWTPLPPERREAMRGVSWHEGCPVALDALALVTLKHWDLEGGIRDGELVVSQAVADEVVEAFRRLYDARFPIARMQTIEAFGGSDDASMAANNTSAFNCRKMTGRAEYSRHSWGEAIDLNPLVNPYVRGKLVLPPEGRKWRDRTKVVPGVIVKDGPAVAAFDAIGWKWGGNWKRYKDYQHFSRDGS